MKIADLAPKDDAAYGAERMFIAGESGTGKSTLTAKIVAAIPDAKDKKGRAHGWCRVVIDSKQDWEHDRRPLGKRTYKRLPLTDLRLVPDGYYVYRPRTYPEKHDDGARRIFRTALMRKYCIIVIDEGADFADVPEMGKLIRQARSKHVIVVFGTQRPVAVMLLSITEASRIICFQLGSADDYKRLGKWANMAFLTPPDGEHDFNVFDRRTKQFTRIKQ